MGRDTLTKEYTCHEANIIFNDKLPPFMASVPTVIYRKYGAVRVTQEDIDQANFEIENNA